MADVIPPRAASGSGSGSDGAHRNVMQADQLVCGHAAQQPVVSGSGNDDERDIEVPADRLAFARVFLGVSVSVSDGVSHDVRRGDRRGVGRTVPAVGSARQPLGLSHDAPASWNACPRANACSLLQRLETPVCCVAGQTCPRSPCPANQASCRLPCPRPLRSCRRVVPLSRVRHWHVGGGLRLHHVIAHLARFLEQSPTFARKAGACTQPTCFFPHPPVKRRPRTAGPAGCACYQSRV